MHFAGCKQKRGNPSHNTACYLTEDEIGMKIE